MTGGGLADLGGRRARLVEASVRALGQVDLVLHAVGAWHATLHTNVVAFNLLVRALQPHLAPGALVAAPALESSLRAWRAERPGTRFTCVVVGATQPSDFGAGFTPEALGDALPAWVRHGRLREAFMDAGDLAGAVLGALAAAPGAAAGTG
ncbi:MAG TPA: hypothetical protein VKB57_15310 [Acidimicrobiales bacterium]|nr:hypothetical protein [Acidimicrobiales bacterium]